MVQESHKVPPPAAEAVADVPHARKEPVQGPATRPAQPLPEIRSKPTLKELRVASRVVLSRNDFESEPAVILAAPAAEYPDAARGTGTSAEVIIGFTIDETGAVRNPAVERSQVRGSAPEALFQEAALAAARSARFTPARERGIPTRPWSTLTFSFESGSPSAGI